MNFTYLLLANLYLCCWLGLYHLICNRKTTFALNRYLLLAGFGLAALLPLITWPPLFNTATAGMATVSAGQVTVLSAPGEDQASTLPLWTLLLVVYWTGVAVSLGILLWKMFKIRYYIRKFPHQRRAGYVHVLTPPHWEVFSFAHYLFAPASIGSTIRAHEKVHIRQRHVLDNLLTELLRVCCWFNPVIYRYQKDIKMNHEYLADAATVQIVEIREYAQKLVNQSFRLSALSLVHPFFNRSHLQKRLIMLQKNKTRNKGIWTYFLLLPALAGVVLITSSFSFKSRLADTLAALKPAEVSGMPATVARDTTITGMLRTPSGEPVDGATILVPNRQQGTQTDAQGHFSFQAPAQAVIQISKVGFNSLTLRLDDANKPLDVTFYPKPESLNRLTVVAYNKDTLPPPPPPPSARAQNAQSSGTNRPKVFQFVEQMPSFPGGESALMQYLSGHIKYPQKARDQNLQGTVVVQFIVEKNGQISNIQTVGDPIGGKLEEEAKRVVKQMPHWHSGKQNGKPVRVQYSLPIRFILQ